MQKYSQLPEQEENPEEAFWKVWEGEVDFLHLGKKVGSCILFWSGEYLKLQT